MQSRLRFLLVSVLINVSLTPLGWAQSVNERITTLGHAMAGRSVPSRHRNPALLEGSIADADHAYETSFAEIEARLHAAGLTSKLADWHSFTDRYRTQMASVRGRHPNAKASDLTDIIEPPQPASVNAIRSVHAVYRAALPVNGSSTVSVPRVDPSDLPTSADLAETKLVQLTPEIRSLAARYGNFPAALHAFVHDNIEFAPYNLAMQNSQAVLWSGRASDVDQATLLISLLRSAGVPARYVVGTILIPYDDAIAWVGVKDLVNAKRLLGTATFLEDTGDKLRIAHTWVETYFDSGTGPRWSPMAPAIKTHMFQPGILLPKPLFDRAQFLSSVMPIVASEAYEDQIRAGMRQNYPNRAITDLPYTGAIVHASSTALPYDPETIAFHTSEWSQANEHRVTINVLDANTSANYLTKDLYLPEVCLQSITVSFGPATSADQQTIQAFGSLDATPAALINLVPQLRLNGSIVTSGNTPLAAGQTVYLEIVYYLPNTKSELFRVKHTIQAGSIAAVGLIGSQSSNGLLASRIDRLLNQLPSGAASDSTGELLNIATLRYYQRYRAERKRIGDELQLRYVDSRAEEAAAIATADVQKLFDRPLYLVPGQLILDAQGLNPDYLDLNATDTSSFQDRNANEAVNIAGSGLEHELWEELVLIPSISTVKALQLARQAGIPLLTIDKSNAAQQLSLLNASGVPASTQQFMQADINQGNTILTPQKLVTLNAFTGLGWISQYPDGREAFLIQQINGGVTTGPPQPYGGDPGPVGNPGITNGTARGDPVNVSNGNLFQQETDLYVSSRGPPMLIQRTYNSLLAGSDGPFGFGWTHSYNWSLKDNQTSATIVTGGGGAFTFPLQGSAYVSAPGLDMALTKDANGFMLRAKSGTIWRFSAVGKLQNITDRNGNALQLAYDTVGRLLRLTDALGRAVTLSYDGQNRISGIVDFTGRRVTYTYDLGGNLISATDPIGNRTTYAYSTDPIFRNKLKTITSPAGKVTDFEYYANGKVARVTEPGGRTMRFNYLPLRNETVFIDDRGFSSHYFYNALGNVTRIVQPDGNSVDYSYSADAKLTSATNEIGQTTSFAYDVLGNITKLTDPMGAVTQFTYEPKFNQVSSVTDARGAVTRFEYDASGDLVHLVQPLGVEGKYTYNTFGNVLTATDAEGSTTSFTYDSGGNPVTSTDPLGNITNFQFDSLRRLTGVVDALNHTSGFQYDALSRTNGLVDALGNNLALAFDPNGNLSQITDPNGQATRYSYDSLDALSVVSDPLGNTTQYSSVTPDCNCTAGPAPALYRDASGSTRSFEHNFRNQLTQATDGLGNTLKFNYDSRGYLVTKKDANGNSTTFAHDGNGRITARNSSDGTYTSFTYDPNGNLASATNANTTETFSYDSLNRLTSVTDSRFPKTLRYTYDRNGRRTMLTDSEGGTFSYVYDRAGRLVSIANPAGSSARFGYDAAGRRTTLAYSNGTSASAQFDGGDRLTSLNWGSISQLQYAYDSNGNTTAITDSSGKHSYRYDSLNRLTAATHPALLAESYSYDGAGNRTASAAAQDYSYDANERLVTAEAATYAYDNNGNLTTRTDLKGLTIYTYNIENQLVGIMFPDGTAAYKYDAFGRRIEKNVNGTITRYLYDGADILLEFDGNNQLQARYTQGPAVDEPLMVERNGQMYFYHNDRLGSISAVTDSSGNPVCSYSYDPFGRTQACQALLNPFGFAGREYDTESRLYYMRARYYDPVTGRFISSDPLDFTGLLLAGAGTGVPWMPQQLNPYSYAVNNPLASRDPSGLRSTSGVLSWTSSSNDVYDSRPRGMLAGDLLSPQTPYVELGAGHSTSEPPDVITPGSLIAALIAPEVAGPVAAGRFLYLGPLASEAAVMSDGEFKAALKLITEGRRVVLADGRIAHVFDAGKSIVVDLEASAAAFEARTAAKWAQVTKSASAGIK